jgi:hypothetical protein
MFALAKDSTPKRLLQRLVRPPWTDDEEFACKDDPPRSNYRIHSPEPGFDGVQHGFDALEEHAELGRLHDRRLRSHYGDRGFIMLIPLRRIVAPAWHTPRPGSATGSSAPKPLPRHTCLAVTTARLKVQPWSGRPHPLSPPPRTTIGPEEIDTSRTPGKLDRDGK